MADEKRLIDANAINEKCRATKIIAVFPEWADLPLSAKKVVVRLGNYFKNIVKEAPTVDAVEVVHGRWIRHWGHEECSECGYRYSYLGGANYCPNCGAKMDGDGNG